MVLLSAQFLLQVRRQLLELPPLEQLAPLHLDLETDRVSGALGEVQLLMLLLVRQVVLENQRRHLDHLQQTLAVQHRLEALLHLLKLVVLLQLQLLQALGEASSVLSPPQLHFLLSAQSLLQGQGIRSVGR